MMKERLDAQIAELQELEEFQPAGNVGQDPKNVVSWAMRDAEVVGLSVD